MPAPDISVVLCAALLEHFLGGEILVSRFPQPGLKMMAADNQSRRSILYSLLVFQHLWL